MFEAVQSCRSNGQSKVAREALLFEARRRQPEIVLYGGMPLNEALTLFRRLGIHVETMSRGDFRISFFALAKRYHPDRNPGAAEFMANINAQRTAILNSYRELAS